MNIRTSSVLRVSSATAGAWHHGQGGGLSSSSTSTPIDLAIGEIARRDVAARLAAPVDDGRRPGLPDDPRAIAAAFGTALRRERLLRRLFRLQVGGTENEVACVAAVMHRGCRAKGARAVASALGADERLRLRHTLGSTSSVPLQSPQIPQCSFDAQRCVFRFRSLASETVTYERRCRCLSR